MKIDFERAKPEVDCLTVASNLVGCVACVTDSKISCYLLHTNGRLYVCLIYFFMSNEKSKRKGLFKKNQDKARRDDEGKTSNKKGSDCHVISSSARKMSITSKIYLKFND